MLTSNEYIYMMVKGIPYIYTTRIICNILISTVLSQINEIY